jgi:transposase
MVRSVVVTIDAVLVRQTMKLGALAQRERRERERLRLVAAELFVQGVRQVEIVRLLEVSPQTVNNWHKRWVRDGHDGLLSTGPSGPRSYLDEEQFRALVRELDKGPAAHGWEDQRWTLARIGRVITETTRVVYAASDGVWRLLTRIGWSWQTPTRRAVERHEEAIRAWRIEVWPRVKDPQPGPGHGSASSTSPEPR